MAAKNPEHDEGVVIRPKAKELTEAEEREMFREAIPCPTAEVSEEELEAVESEEDEEAEPESKNESTLDLFGTPEEADISAAPYKCGGKLYFRKADGILYTCTAEFVGEYNILLCAAHCVRDHKTGDWYSDFVFYGAYKNGSYRKRFDINCVGTKNGWVDNTAARWRYDYAFLRTTTKSDVGYMGYKTLQNEKAWTAFGYPANYGNNQVMYKVDGTRGRLKSGTVEMLGNPMRKGNSGGAWFVVASPNNRQALGNESFNIRGNTTDMWGPVFTNSTFTLLRYVRDHT